MAFLSAGSSKYSPQRDNLKIDLQPGDPGTAVEPQARNRQRAAAPCALFAAADLDMELVVLLRNIDPRVERDQFHRPSRQAVPYVSQTST